MATAYAALKQELAFQFTSDCTGYTAAKADFIQSILSKQRCLADQGALRQTVAGS